MCNARVCPICGMWFKDCFTLYRHHVDVHRRRFCWYCAFEEGKPSRMRRHVATEHPTVCLDMDERVWRNETETLREVPASFPTPPGYVPYREEDLQQPFPFPFVYIPTPKDLCPRAPDSRPDQAAPAAEATEAAAAAVGVSPAQEVSDWEEMGVEIVIEEEATEDGPPILRQQRVVSVQPVDDEIPGPNDTRTIQCAARDLLATAGLEDIPEEDELQQDPLACLQALTRKVRAALGHATPSPCPATEDPSRKKPRMSGEEHSSLASASSTPPSVSSVPEESVLMHFPHAPPTPPPQVPSSSSPSAPVLVHITPAPPTPPTPVPSSSTVPPVVVHVAPAPPTPPTPAATSSAPVPLVFAQVTPGCPSPITPPATVPASVSPPVRHSWVADRAVDASEEALDLSRPSRPRPSPPPSVGSPVVDTPATTLEATPPHVPLRRPLTCTCRCHCTCGACCPCQCVCESVEIKETRF